MPFFPLHVNNTAKIIIFSEQTNTFSFKCLFLRKKMHIGSFSKRAMKTITFSSISVFYCFIWVHPDFSLNLLLQNLEDKRKPVFHHEVPDIRLAYGVLSYHGDCPRPFHDQYLNGVGVSFKISPDIFCQTTRIVVGCHVQYNAVCLPNRVKQLSIHRSLAINGFQVI